MPRIAGQFDFYAKRNGLMHHKLAGGEELGAALRHLTSKVTDPLEALGEHVRGAGLGWLSLPASEEWAEQSQAQASRLRAEAGELLVCGIGGSVLGTQAVYEALAMPPGALRKLHFIDNVDPAQIQRAAEGIDFTNCAICVVTKSGGTLETLGAFAYFLEKLSAAGLSPAAIAARTAVVTGTHPSSLRHMAQQNEWALLPVPSEVGGRFSVLSPVGLLPLAFAGVDIAGLLSGARRAQEDVRQSSGSDNQALRLAAIHFLLHTQGNCPQVVQYVYGDPLLPLAYWWRQLWAESIAKAMRLDGRPALAGQSPQVARGATDQHSQNQLFLDGPADKMYGLLGCDRWPADPAINVPDLPGAAEAFRTVEHKRFGELLSASMLGTRDALIERDRPLYELLFHELTPAALGAYLQFWMLTTAFAGMLYGLNPFDQPAVELSKKMTRKRL